MGTNTTFSCPNDSRLSTGGEYSGAMVYIAESSPDKSVVYSVVVLKLEHSQVTFCIGNCYHFDVIVNR